jgi:hypothetical protein
MFLSLVKCISIEFYWISPNFSKFCKIRRIRLSPIFCSQRIFKHCAQVCRPHPWQVCPLSVSPGFAGTVWWARRFLRQNLFPLQVRAPVSFSHSNSLARSVIFGSSRCLSIYCCPKRCSVPAQDFPHRAQLPPPVLKIPLMICSVPHFQLSPPGLDPWALLVFPPWWTRSVFDFIVLLNRVATPLQVRVSVLVIFLGFCRHLIWTRSLWSCSPLWLEICIPLLHLLLLGSVLFCLIWFCGCSAWPSWRISGMIFGIPFWFLFSNPVLRVNIFLIDMWF